MKQAVQDGQPDLRVGNEQCIIWQKWDVVLARAPQLWPDDMVRSTRSTWSEAEWRCTDFVVIVGEFNSNF